MIYNDEREGIIEKALKIRELANRGVDGEKSAAITMLNNYKEKHNITEEELNSFVAYQNDWYINLSKEGKTSKFAVWFKNSVTVYNKQPIIFYHKSRTLEPFNEFEHYKGRKLYGEGTNYGFHFCIAEDRGRVEHLGNDHNGNGVSFEVYLKIVSPYYIYLKLNGNCYGQNGEPHIPIYIDKILVDRLISEGFDAIIMQGESSINMYVVFNANQIKSKDKNNGEYSESNNIYE